MKCLVLDGYVEISKQIIGRDIWNCMWHVQEVVSGGGWLSSNILVCMTNTSRDLKMSVIFQRTGVRLWAWNQVRMEPVISLTHGSLILVASIASIFLKCFAGMVVMDGIGSGGEVIIRTSEDWIWNTGNDKGVKNGVRFVTVFRVYACMNARVKTGMWICSASAVGLIRTGDFYLK